MYKLTIEAESAKELKSKIAELAAETVDAKTNTPVVESVQKAEEPVVSHGKAWQEVPGMPGAYQGVEIDESSPRRKEPLKSVELDDQGNPFDIRIHAATRAKNVDGSWRYKRGVAKEIIEEVEAELKARMNTPSPQVPSPPAPTVKVEMPAFKITPATPAPAPEQNFAPVNVNQGFIPPSYDFKTFRNQIPMIMLTLLNAKKLDEAYINSLKEYFGVKETWQLGQDEVKCKEMFDQFAACGFILKVG